jgi:putative sigma-54 modulation protein
MDITINARNITLSKGLETFIHERLTRLTRYLPNISSVTVDLSSQKSNRGPDEVTAQITIRHARGAILRTEERLGQDINNDAIKAVTNAAIDKMYRRISRFKGKRKDKRDRAGNKFEATIEEIEIAEDIPEEEIENAPDAEQQDPLIYRRKIVPVSPMSEEEAIEQMELLGHRFFVFYHADRNRINVLYKRDSGGYGVLDPKLD